jgi:hypothetical protein
MNGFEAGDTISIRRPTDFTVRDGATALNQDIVEAKVSLVVDKQKGVDFGFTSKELTLNINELSERVIKPAMVQLANQIDSDVYGLYKYVPNWVGTPGTRSTRSPDFAKAPELLDKIRRSAGRTVRRSSLPPTTGACSVPRPALYSGRGEGRLS